ncbi:MAG TPA: DedA family protein [Hymenobacter sp.]
MELIKQFFDLVLHLDKTLIDVVHQYGGLTYLILFLIVFMETGIVIFPFLPGDSLLFVAGALAAKAVAPGSEQTLLHLTYLIPLLFTAALLGDNVNYFVGDYLGPRVFRGDFKLLKREYLEQTQAFYAKHGGKTIIMARFIPIVRTFAPFVAGVGSMRYSYFISYSVGGALFWVILLTMAGYLFGNIPIVEKNFTIVIYGIILISVAPPLFQFLKQKLSGNSAQA